MMGSSCGPGTSQGRLSRHGSTGTGTVKGERVRGGGRVASLPNYPQVPKRDFTIGGGPGTRLLRREGRSTYRVNNR